MINKLKNSSALQRARQMSAAAMLCIVCLLFFMPAGCGKEDDLISLTVYDTPNYSIQFSEYSDEVFINCTMLTMEEGSNVEQNIELNAIKNFTYETGYEYHLKVKKTANDDYLYLLDEIVSKTLKYELETIILFVSSELANIDDGINEVMLIQEEGIPFWYRYFAKIEGFEYDKRFDYHLKVKKTVVKMPALSGMNSFNVYSLIEIISKTPKIE